MTSGKLKEGSKELENMMTELAVRKKNLDEYTPLLKRYAYETRCPVCEGKILAETSIPRLCSDCLKDLVKQLTDYRDKYDEDYRHTGESELNSIINTLAGKKMESLNTTDVHSLI